VPRRAAIYTRISLDQTGEGAGVERQAEDCRKLIEQREWSAVAAHSDNSISAAGKRRRPGFDALLGQVERGELDVIVAWAWDRLSRNRRDEVRLIEACKEHAVSVTLVRGAGDLDMSSAVGRGIAEIMATLGRLENEQKSERQRRALKQLAEQGRPWGSRRPFGYQVGGMELEPAEGALLREAYGDRVGGCVGAGHRGPVERGRCQDEHGARGGMGRRCRSCCATPQRGDPDLRPGRETGGGGSGGVAGDRRRDDVPGGRRDPVRSCPAGRGGPGA
jgi:DNA invertase Pin-like site-specific DNA recombinase